MESVDMKKLETAIVYLQRIADGNNPINNLPADEDSVLNNPNVIRCMFFVKEVLDPLVFDARLPDDRPSCAYPLSLGGV